MARRHERLVRPGVYLAIMAALFTLVMTSLEAYCRWSPRFSADHQTFIKQVVLASARNAVFGDSHVGQTSYIKGFDFLGQAGQKPEELLRLVRFLYTLTPPDQIILEMAPQWLSLYHVANPEVMLNEGALPPASPVRLLILSRYFREGLRKNLVDDAIDAVTSKKAAAAEIAGPVDGKEVSLLTEEWRALLRTHTNMNWAMMERPKRRILTLYRLSAQNPVADFSHTSGAKELETAIDYLIGRGAKLCLFRTPVTSDYIELSRQIADSRYDAFSDYAKQVAARRAVPFVNFADLNYVFDDSKFLNQDHLNALSAAEVWPLVKQACFRN